MILVVDASKSMRADDGSGQPKIAAAKSALNTLVDELPADAKVGLRVFGSRVSGTGRAKGCADSRLVSPVAPLDREGLKSSIDAITPRGFTPIGTSLQGGGQGPGEREAEDGRARLRRRRQLRAAGAVRGRPRAGARAA